ncbi:DUF6255 family natural product biosynthesis protein [Streptomyces sp. NPDC053048]|uniref:DUF6255 family natural product biosynthesis protein n=1 Tax=Streptomyces sp. NPDC053048 TaxID=3365694 RepID=UPI0037D0F2FE
MLTSGCPHPSGWTHDADGSHRCERCGTRRFGDYAALRPPGLPAAVPQRPSPRCRRAADCAAASYVAYRGLSRRPDRFCPGPAAVGRPGR